MKYLLIALTLFSQVTFADFDVLSDQLDKTHEFLRESVETNQRNQQIEALNKIDSDLRDLNTQLSNDDMKNN